MITIDISQVRWWTWVLIFAAASFGGGIGQWLAQVTTAAAFN